jgi:hypothetical protein
MFYDFDNASGAFVNGLRPTPSQDVKTSVNLPDSVVAVADAEPLPEIEHVGNPVTLPGGAVNVSDA